MCWCHEEKGFLAGHLECWHESVNTLFSQQSYSGSLRLLISAHGRENHTETGQSLILLRCPLQRDDWILRMHAPLAAAICMSGWMFRSRFPSAML